MKLIIAIFLFAFSLPAFSQLGINVRYQNIDSELWKKWTNEENLFSNGYEIGLDYWFRLKNRRVEFMPEVYISRSSTQASAGPEVFKYAAYGISVNTNFYLFDFVGDCNCPTFSKDGNFFTKGFHLSLAPLLEFQVRTAEPLFQGAETSRHIGYGAAIGAGVDIGITDLITITPYLRYKYQPNAKWDGLALVRAEAGSEVTTTNLGYLQFGIRLGFRPDYVREQNKYRFRR